MKRDPWAGPLKVHLSLLIITLLIGVALPLIWLGYERGHSAAVAAAEQERRLLTDRTVDRYRIVFGNAAPIVSMAAASEAFVKPPPADLAGKSSFLLRGLKASPYIDGIYAGYPDGSFVHAVSLDNNKNWRSVLVAPQRASFALRVIATETTGARLSTWYFLNDKGQIVGALNPAPSNYDPRQRPWYRQALVASGPLSVGPYVMATTKALGLTVFERHESDPQVVAGADILLATVAEFLAEEKVSPRGSAYVLNATGDLIIHSDPAVMDELLAAMVRKSGPNPTGREVEDPVFDAVRAAFAGGTGDGERIANFTVAGEPYMASTSAIRFSRLL